MDSLEFTPRYDHTNDRKVLSEFITWLENLGSDTDLSVQQLLKTHEHVLDIPELPRGIVLSQTLLDQSLQLPLNELAQRVRSDITAGIHYVAIHNDNNRYLPLSAKLVVDSPHGKYATMLNMSDHFQPIPVTTEKFPKKSLESLFQLEYLATQMANQQLFQMLSPSHQEFMWNEPSDGHIVQFEQYPLDAKASVQDS